MPIYVLSDAGRHRDLTVSPGLNSRQVLKNRNYAGMIHTTTASDTQGCEQLFDNSGDWNRRSNRPRCILNKIEILEMQIDFETRSKVSRQYFFRFLVEALAARQ